MMDFGRSFFWGGEKLTEDLHDKRMPARDLLDLAGQNDIFVHNKADRNDHTWMLDLGDYTTKWKDHNMIHHALFQTGLVTEEELRVKNFTFLTSGTTYGIRKIDGEDALVLTAAFWPWKSMTPKEVEDFRFLAKWFATREKDGHTKPIKYNSAHAEGGSCR